MRISHDQWLNAPFPPFWLPVVCGKQMMQACSRTPNSIH